jgi:hypothetical protein
MTDPRSISNDATSIYSTWFSEFSFGYCDLSGGAYNRGWGSGFCVKLPAGESCSGDGCCGCSTGVVEIPIPFSLVYVLGFDLAEELDPDRLCGMAVVWDAGAGGGRYGT